jgi:transcriptional regulator with XRE-family HTH domain
MDRSILFAETPVTLARVLAGRTKALRLQVDWTRRTLALRSGVTEASLKRFETTGAASLDLVLRVAFALGRMEDFARVLAVPEAATLADLREREARPARRRGRR